jgi:hypothetical protein
MRCFVFGVLVLCVACSDDSTINPGTTSTASSSSTGGGGGEGGAGGGGEGGGGGGAGGCLDPATYEAVLTVDAPELCVVAQYDAPFVVSYALVPGWGRHDGLLVLEQGTGDQITLTRWQAPAGASGELTSIETVGPFSLGIPDPSPFVTPLAVDLPIAPWTMIGWTGLDSTGEILAVDGETVAERWANAGYFGAGAVGDAASARLLHTGLDPLGNDALPGVPGFYASDFCRGPMLCNGGAGAVDFWGSNTGPVAVDAIGTAFAVMTDFGAGTQELRGYAAAAVAPGSPPSPDAPTMWTLEGFGTALAAVPPTSGESGIVLYQPFDPSSFAALDLVGQRYKADATADGPYETAVTFVTDGTEVSLVSDTSGRVWMGVPDAGADTTVFYVLDRAP